jgi:class 3 adenylate cyclase
MEATYSSYDFEKSRKRIDEILNSSDAKYEDKDSIPSREELTYDNGYYVNCSAIFIDMRDSKTVNDKHRRPTLAKIYKTYISEAVAVIRSHSSISEISIEGDCVWGVADTPKTYQIDELFNIAAKLSSLVDTLNIKYKKKGYSQISVGIGLSYGASLLIKAGHKGSAVNDAVWLGKLVGETAELCSHGNRTWNDKELMVSSTFYYNLCDRNKSLLTWNSNRNCYHGNLINTEMDEWVSSNG